MAQNITIAGAAYPSVPSIQCPKTGGGTAVFVEPSVVTATASDVASGKYFINSSGVLTQGTATGGGGVDFPVFTVTVDVHDTVQSIACNKTYAQCKQFLENEGTLGAVVRIHPNYPSSDSDYGVYGGYTDYDGTFYALYGPVFILGALYDIKYWSNGSIELVSSEFSGEEGTPVATKGAVNNHSIAVTPSVVNTGGFIDGDTTITGTPVTVSASELVSGSQTITSNNTYDVTNLASVVVNVSGGGGGGLTSVVRGSFNYSAEGWNTIAVPYTGSGYPIGLLVYVKNGEEDSAFSSTIRRYALARFSVIKTDTTTFPSYDGSAKNVIVYRYKSNATSATTYTQTSGTTSVFNTTESTSNSGPNAVRISANDQIKVRMVDTTNNTSRYGFLVDTDYEYLVVYSS